MPGLPSEQVFLQQTIFEFERLKKLSESAIAQVTDEQLFLVPAADANSMAVIMRHLSGNMISRWTDFLTSDGEKPWRNRDAEFEEQTMSREELMTLWEKGWTVFLDTLRSLKTDDIQKTVTIRGEVLLVMQAILRQLGHYSYHVGQLIFVARMHCGENWKSLSIPRGKSSDHSQGNYLGKK
ncbi:MAG: hypothetical protein FD123_2231 [Bacteroidetes bacterium]|nr:MAG: hypothetical protein FD123_2231 [Bacteroidota bacterium]